MGVQEAIHLCLSIMKEFAKRFSQEDINLIQTIAKKVVMLSVKTRNADEELQYTNERAALAECVKKCQFALINESKSYEDLGKVIKVLTA